MQGYCWGVEEKVPSKDTTSHTYRIKDINLIVGLVFLVGKTSNLRPGNLRSVTFQLIESWKLEAGC